MDDIYKRLFGLIKYLEVLCDEDGSGECMRQFENLILYWRLVKETLKEPNQLSIALKDDLWPFI